MNMLTSTLRTCRRCGESFPATTEYFYRDNRTPGGLRSCCVWCMDEINRPSKLRMKNEATPQGTPLCPCGKPLPEHKFYCSDACRHTHTLRTCAAIVALSRDPSRPKVNKPRRVLEIIR